MKTFLLSIALLLPSFNSSLLFGTASPSAQALLRMERVRPREAVCILVGNDGSYRLEKSSAAKTEMYTSSPNSSLADTVHAMLDNEQLRKLSQLDIHLPLIFDTRDDLQFAIWRSNTWQELKFVAPESRKPFKESLDPLLHWLQDMQRQRPGAVRVQGTPTRCQPESVMELVATTQTAGASEPPSRAAHRAGYLFRLSYSHYYRARVDAGCTIVFEDGAYRREQQDQRYLADRKDTTEIGQLTPDAMQQLNAILDLNELKRSPSFEDIGNVGSMHEGTTTVLAIPRPDRMQSLVFSTAFNTVGSQLEVGGKSNLQYHVADLKLLGPLSDWMKIHTDQSRNATLRRDGGDDCSATPLVANRK